MPRPEPVTKFNPMPHMMTIDREVTDKVTRKKTVIKNDYLEVKWRLLWLRTEYPDAIIRTKLVNYNNDAFEAIVHASVELTDGGGIGEGLGVCKQADWKAGYVEKAETAALGRALAALGFGTQFCGQEFDMGEDDGGKLADAPVELPAHQAPPAVAPRPSHLLDEAQKQGASLVPVVPQQVSPGRYARPASIPMSEWTRLLGSYVQQDAQRGNLLNADRFAYEYKSALGAPSLIALLGLRPLPGKPAVNERQVMDGIATYLATGEPTPLSDLIPKPAQPSSPDNSITNTEDE